MTLNVIQYFFFFPRTIATISLLAFNSPFKSEWIVSGVPVCRMGSLQTRLRLPFPFTGGEPNPTESKMKELVLLRVKMMNIYERYFSQSAAWSLCSCREKGNLKKGKDRKLIDKSFYCHWQAAFHYPHMPPAHPHSQRILWPHRSPSLIRFFEKKKKNKHKRNVPASWPSSAVYAWTHFLSWHI